MVHQVGRPYGKDGYVSCTPWKAFISRPIFLLHDLCIRVRHRKRGVPGSTRLCNSHEHGYRFEKQSLAWVQPRLRSPAQFERRSQIAVSTVAQILRQTWTQRSRRPDSIEEGWLNLSREAMDFVTSKR